MFIGNPELINEQYVIEFFKINEFDQIAYDQDMKKQQQEGVMKMNNFAPSSNQQDLPAGGAYTLAASTHTYNNPPPPPPSQPHSNYAQQKHFNENLNNFANQNDPASQISSSSIYNNSYRGNAGYNSAAPNYVYNKHGPFQNQTNQIRENQTSLYDV